MGDELAKAITKIIRPLLKDEGFLRTRRREFVRIENGIAQRLDFQVNSWGGRDFCVNISANLIASNEFVTLQPGFRLTREGGVGDLWLPSRTKEEAEQSTTAILRSIRAEAFPFFEKTRTVERISAVLAEEEWGSAHHLSFQRGVAAALMSDATSAREHLTDAIRLYEEDGREWCASYSVRANQLREALAKGNANRLLTDWEQRNWKAHRGN